MLPTEHQFEALPVTQQQSRKVEENKAKAPLKRKKSNSKSKHKGIGYTIEKLLHDDQKTISTGSNEERSKESSPETPQQEKQEKKTIKQRLKKTKEKLVGKGADSSETNNNPLAENIDMISFLINPLIGNIRGKIRPQFHTMFGCHYPNHNFLPVGLIPIFLLLYQGVRPMVRMVLGDHTL
jgi:hypothetical protein